MPDQKGSNKPRSSSTQQKNQPKKGQPKKPGATQAKPDLNKGEKR